MTFAIIYKKKKNLSLKYSETDEVSTRSDMFCWWYSLVSQWKPRPKKYVKVWVKETINTQFQFQRIAHNAWIDNV